MRIYTADLFVRHPDFELLPLPALSEYDYRVVWFCPMSSDVRGGLPPHAKKGERPRGRASNKMAGVRDGMGRALGSLSPASEVDIPFYMARAGFWV